MSFSISPQGEDTAAHAVSSANLRLARELRQSRRWAEAAYRYRCVLDEDGNCFEAAVGHGAALLELGKAEEAIPSLQRATGLDQNSFEAHATLALAFDRLTQWEAAVTSYERALSVRPADQQTLLRLGFALSRLDRRGELNAWLEKAIAGEPETATLYGMLASQLFAFGRFDEALAAMDVMIAGDPENGYAHALLSDLKTFSSEDPHFVALERAARSGSQSSDDERCVLGYALGKAYADVGRQEESFQQYLAANRLRRGMIRYDLAPAIAGLDRVKAVFTPALMQARRGFGDPSDRPVFIVGFMRSGTTLIEQILASHSRIYGLGESPDAQLAVEQVLASYPDQVPSLAAGDFRRIAQSYLLRTKPVAAGVVRVVDKTLSNDLFVGLLHLALPEARFIHVLRDPIDTCLSVFATNFGAAYPYSNDLFELGRYFRAERDLMTHWRTLLPERALLEVRYEEVVANIEEQTRRMLDFCGLDWDPACLAFDKSRRAVFTASARQVRRPLFQTSIGRWRPEGALLKPLLDGLGEYARPNA